MVTIAKSQRQPVGYTAEIGSYKATGYGLDIEIVEKPKGDGISLRVKIEGLSLSRRQHRLLCRALAIWKWGLRETPAPSPFAQHLGITEYEHL